VQRRSWALVAAIAAMGVAGLVYAATRDDGRHRAEGTADDVPRTTTSSTTPAARLGTEPPTTTSIVGLANPMPSTDPTQPGPPFESRIVAVTATDLGSSWREGCPVPPEDLRALELSHWDYDGAVQRGRLVVHAAYAEPIVAVFRDLFAARFPVERVTPIDTYGGDDQASMRANNTSGFNCRYVAGTSRWSEHAFGRAIDVNPLVNPYVRGSSVDPPEGAPYADRRRDEPGMIHGGDAAVRAFAAQGWKWGGYWSNGKDYQHFSATGR